VSREAAGLHAEAGKIELVPERALYRLIRLPLVVPRGVDRSQRCQDPDSVADILIQDAVELYRGSVRPRFGRTEALHDDESELTIEVPDVPNEDAVARLRPRGGRPNEADREQGSRRSRAIEEPCHRWNHGLP
jgi:hypothetical protein